MIYFILSEYFGYSGAKMFGLNVFLIPERNFFFNYFSFILE